MADTDRFFKELSNAAGSAGEAFSTLKTDLEATVRAKVESVLSGMNLVPREEFEIVREMAATAREEQIRMEKRLCALENAFPETAGKACEAADKGEPACDTPEAGENTACEHGEDKGGDRGPCDGSCGA